MPYIKDSASVKIDWVLIWKLLRYEAVFDYLYLFLTAGECLNNDTQIDFLEFCQLFFYKNNFLDVFECFTPSVFRISHTITADNTASITATAK